jgi:hypothetical protein
MNYSLPDIEHVNGILRENPRHASGNPRTIIPGESDKYNVIHADSVPHR